MKNMLMLTCMFTMFYGCIDTTLPDTIENPSVYFEVHDMGLEMCEYSWPLVDNPDSCTDDFTADATCCTWYSGHGCYEEWCTWDGTCEWEFQFDYCIY